MVNNKSFDIAIRIISWIREIRSNYNIPKSQKLDLYIDLLSIDLSIDLFCLASNGVEELMMKWNMGNLNKIEYNLFGLFEGGSFFESQHISGVNVYISIDQIDKQLKLSEISKEIDRIKNQINSSEKKLLNSKFVENAPKDIVDQEIKKISDFKNALRMNRSIITQLEVGKEEYDLIIKFGSREKLFWHVQYLRELNFTGEEYSIDWFSIVYNEEILDEEIMELYLNI